MHSTSTMPRFIPDVLEELLTGHDPSTASTILPPELLDQVIDHLHDDKPTLLALGLVSKQTLVRSRSHLFSKLEFTRIDNTRVTNQEVNRQFDAFLSLLEAPWTTFTFAVESLHINNLFWYRGTGYKYRPNRNISRIAARLSNLKSLWLTSLTWTCVPPQIQEFFFQLNIADLQLDRVHFEPDYPNNLIEFFSRIQSSVKTLTLYRILLDKIPDLSQHYSIFHQRFRFKTLDGYSLVLFIDVWDPSVSKDLNIAVESFHLRLETLTQRVRELDPYNQRVRELYIPFISRFLQRFGRSIHRLFLYLSDPFNGGCCKPILSLSYQFVILLL